MKRARLERRLKHTEEFLLKHSVGLFDREQARKHLYVRHDIAEELSVGSLIADMVSGLKAPAATNELLRDYRKIWIPHQHSYSSVLEVLLLDEHRPSVIVELCCGEGDVMQMVQEGFRDVLAYSHFLGIDQNGPAIRRALKLGIQNAFFLNGTIDTRGQIAATSGAATAAYGRGTESVPYEDILSMAGPMLVVALRACGDATDNAAAFAARQNADFVYLKRCCYDRLSEKEFKYLKLPLTHKVAAAWKRAYRQVHHGAEKANLLLMDAYSYGVSLDLALRLDDSGYDTALTRDSEGFFTVWGISRAKMNWLERKYFWAEARIVAAVHSIAYPTRSAASQ